MKTINNELIRSFSPCYDPSEKNIPDDETLTVVEATSEELAASRVAAWDARVAARAAAWDARVAARALRR